MMTENEDRQALEEWIEWADDQLSAESVPLATRPLQATILLIGSAVIEDDEGPIVVSEIPNYLTRKWFAPLSSRVADWYSTRFGAGGINQSEDLLGLALVRGTPLLLRIPAVSLEPGEVVGTVWVSFLAGVGPSEQCFHWISPSFNIDTFAPDARTALLLDIQAVASDLRRVNVGIIGAKRGGDAELTGLLSGVVHHLSQAAQCISKQNADEVQRGYWELQMAAEVAMKSLLLQKTRVYQKTHDLIQLRAQVRQLLPNLMADCLAKFPSKAETIRRRYAIGTGHDFKAAFESYRCVLSTIREVVEGLDAMTLSKARFLIKRAPWAL